MAIITTDLKRAEAVARRLLPDMAGLSLGEQHSELLWRVDFSADRTWLRPVWMQAIRSVLGERRDREWTLERLRLDPEYVGQEKAFLNALIEQPDDAASACAYADWLTDQDYRFAEGWILLGVRQYWPLWTGRRWLWFEEGSGFVDHGAAALPSDVFNLLPGSRRRLLLSERMAEYYWLFTALCEFAGSWGEARCKRIVLSA